MGRSPGNIAVATCSDQPLRGERRVRVRMAFSWGFPAKADGEGWGMWEGTGQAGIDWA